MVTSLKIDAKRDYYFDTLKGILILLVVIGNSLELSESDLPGIHYFILFLYMFHMPLFAFISGYFCKKGNRTTVQKVSETFILYIATQFFYFIFYKYLIGEPDLKLEFMKPHWTLWYLVSLTFWYILSDYIKSPKKWFLASILVSILVGFDSSVHNYLSISRTIFFLPFFIFGIMFKKDYVLFLKNKRKILLILSLIISLILFELSSELIVDLLFEFVGYESYYPDAKWFALLIRVFHYLGAFVLGATLLSFIPNIKTKFSTLGKYSLYIYLVHSGVSKYLITNEILKYSNYGFLVFSESIILIISILLAYSYSILKLKLKNKYS